MRIAGESVDFDLWEPDCDGEGRRACNNQHPDLGRPKSYLQHPRSSPTRGFAKPRWWLSLTRELGRIQVCVLRFSIEKSGYLQSWSDPPPLHTHTLPGKGAKSWPSSLSSVAPRPIQPQSLAKTPGIYVALQRLERESSRQSRVFAEQSVAPFGQGIWGASHLEPRPQTKSLAGASSPTGPIQGKKIQSPTGC